MSARGRHAPRALFTLLVGAALLSGAGCAAGDCCADDGASACGAPADHAAPHAAPHADAALAPSSADALSAAGWRALPSDTPGRSVHWRLPAGGELPRNRPFDLELLVLHDGAPAALDRLEVHGWMPDHAHGFVQAPRVRALGDGRWAVGDMLLHMRGVWQVRFDLYADGDYEAVVLEREL